VTGIRVDHPDGLFDPAAYFERLQQLSPAPLYVAAEKILSFGESLSPDWPVAGTTGYDFLNLTSGLFVDPRHVTTLRRAYARLTGQTRSFDDVAYEARQTVMQTTMAAELNVLAHALNRLSEQDRRCRDFTLNSCRHVLREVAACFPVYRTHVSDRGVSAFDRQVVSAAIAEARRRNPVMEGSIFDFLRARLLPTDDAPAAVRRFAMKAQQFTAPVQAKGVEDTAFYRYHALVSANEVGGHPAHPAVSAGDFHRANGDRRRDWPLSMLATATHDTKRGEDARLRIAAISEGPDQWRKAVAMWMRLNNRHRTRVDGPWAPDRNDEYLFYQSLVGAWPAELAGAPIPAAAPPEFVDRIAAYMAKAVREAKIHTSWIHQDVAYEEAVDRFVRRTLTGATAPRFFQAFLPLQRRLAQAGAVNSLAQLVLKLSSPGVPDFYQGTELWDLSLVDPDNRRPVDFDARAAALASLGDMHDLAELFSAWPDGRVKLAVTARGLRFRRDHPEVVRDGDYTPLDVIGLLSEHVVAFARRSNGGALIAIVPRLTMSLSSVGAWPMGIDVWRDTRVILDGRVDARSFNHVLNGETVAARDGAIQVGDALRSCPVAMLFASDTLR
jgi:(1->4)-alpha-D-glucan 1-alpha-D-glucosylmutase